MLKKIIISILIVGCLTGAVLVKRYIKSRRAEKIAAETAEEKKLKVNLSTKKGTVRTFTRAIICNEPENMWICFSDETKKMLEDTAKRSGKSVDDLKQEICSDLRKHYLEAFQESCKGEYDELVNAVGRDIGKSWVKKDNKNYIDFRSSF